MEAFQEIEQGEGFAARWRLLETPRGEDKVVAVIQGYFDEAGIHRGAHICALTGFIGSTKRWTEFETRWLKLGADGVAPGFHAKRFFARDTDGKRVSPYVGWSDDRAQRLLDGVVSAVCNTNVHPVGAVLDVAAFHLYSIEERHALTGAIRIGEKWRLRGAPTKPYYLLFQCAIAESLRRLTRPDWRVHFTFEQQNVLSRFALKLYTQLKADPNYNDWAPRMGTASFASRSDAVPLQAADLLAYCWYQVATHGRAGTASDINGVLTAFEVAKDYSLYLFDKESMDRLLKHAPSVEGITVTV